MTIGGLATKAAHLAFAALTIALLAPQAQAEPTAAPRGTTEQAIQQMLDEQVAAITAGRDCWTTTPQGVIPSTLLIRNAHQGIGPDKGNTGVVREVPFDTGWKLAEDGTAWVLGACR